MTDFVSLLLIAIWSLLNAKFSLNLFVYFICNNYNTWWTHKRHFKRRNDSDHEYYFHACCQKDAIACWDEPEYI